MMKPQMNRTMNRSEQAYETTDLNLASFLRCRQFSIRAIKAERGRTTFVFADGEDLRRAVLDFANDEPISVRSFCNTVRDLKALTRVS